MNAPHAEMKLKTIPLIRSLLVTWMCLASAFELAAQVAGSLKNLEIEKAETKMALDAALAQNKALRESLAASESTVTALQKNLAVTMGESEVFRRQSGELNIRLEALGTAKLDDRLVKLLGDLKIGSDERNKLRDALIGLTESITQFEKVAVSPDPKARLDVEAAMRDAAKALGVAPPGAITVAPISSTLTDGLVVSIKEDLALIVVNMGSRHGVKVGMPFNVVRGEAVVGTVRVVDVREKIAGALIQDLSDKQKIKIGDHLRVAARQ